MNKDDNPNIVNIITEGNMVQVDKDGRVLLSKEDSKRLKRIEKMLEILLEGGYPQQFEELRKLQ